MLGCTAIAILPENMSQERFTWLAQIGSEVIATPGCESNVKEIYDKCWELKQDPRHLIFNQFEEFGNPVWHYNVTGPAIEDVFNAVRPPLPAWRATSPPPAAPAPSPPGTTSRPSTPGPAPWPPRPSSAPPCS